MSFLQSSVVFLVSLVSYILYRTTALTKQKLSVGGVSLLDLALYRIHYQGTTHNGTYHFQFSSSRVYLRFHFPSRPNPRWLTFAAEDVFYTSDTCDTSASQLSVTFWFFPLLFRQTAGPWTNVEVEDCRIRIMRSNATPHWIKLLRENLVGALIAGEILRVDDFKTSVRFQGMTDGAGEGPQEKPEDRDENADGQQMPHGDATQEDRAGCDQTQDIRDGLKRKDNLRRMSFLSREEDEMRISACATGLQLHNHEGRIYSFDKVDAQLRRNWTADRGSFVLIAEESRWVRVPWQYQMACVYPWWIQLASSITHFPYDLVHVLNYPMTTVNLYIPRIDITFDEFRIRDAELIMQALSLIREKMALDDIRWQDVLADFVANTALGLLCTQKD